MPAFAKTASGREHWCGGARVPRHRHATAYAALVLSGSYEECGSRGRFRVGAGDVLVHDAFDAHLDRFDACGAEILNLPISTESRSWFVLGCVGDGDKIARMAESNVESASVLLLETMTERREPTKDWPARLATDLLDDPQCRLDRWAAAHHLAAETISRGFVCVFGVTPAAFRAEARARRALDRIMRSAASLADVAASSGFADQAHMTRAIKTLTGAPPGAWRSNRFKTAPPTAA